MVPSRPGERWSMDLLADQLVNGRRIRLLAIADDVTRECLAIHIAQSITGPRVSHVLDQLHPDHGCPSPIVTDNGTEYTINAMVKWSQDTRADLRFIESFNGRLRDECLNEHVFSSLPKARTIIDAWRRS
ncbi:MAG: DDE-type integrase/transposase/recombinase [Alphaproteobacteria bacterium]|nr:DDE-type integrase/transposase/recombinase [Alphaproteobacteria bacterium]